MGHGKAAVEEDDAGAIFKMIIRGPLHANELGREDGEARVLKEDHGFGIGHRIVGGVGGVELRRVAAGSGLGYGGVRLGLGNCGRLAAAGRGVVRRGLGLSQSSPKQDDCGKVKQWNTQGCCLLVPNYERKPNTSTPTAQCADVRIGAIG